LVRKVEVLLEGGLGNQLFGWATGYSLSKRTNAKLILNVSQLGQRGYQLGEFKLRNLTICEKKHPIKSSRRLSKLNPLVHHEKSLNFDSEIFESNNSKFLIGYFQSWKYFNLHMEEIRDMLQTPVSPSEKYMHYENIFKNQNTIVAHVRRGDYKDNENYHGLVKSAYYSSALDNIRQNQHKETKLVVMSDEPELAKAVVQGADFYLGPDDIPSAVETLLLMSKAKYLIGANSSFSLWAGMLMNDAGSIRIFPDPWYKLNSNNSADLVPEQYLRVAAEL
jgi:hypothetical protein